MAAATILITVLLSLSFFPTAISYLPYTQHAHQTPPPPPDPPQQRAAIPLLLTHAQYHGSSLFRTTLKGWVLKLLQPQQNIDLLLFFDQARMSPADIAQGLGLSLNASRPSHISAAEHRLAEPVWYALTPYHTDVTLQLFPTAVHLPRYAAADKRIQNQIQNDSTWRLCGCPPYCPARRASVEYVQGTRWYTSAMFLERSGMIRRRYAYWIKLDVDIWVFRPPPFNLVEEMLRHTSAIVAHTGKAYNGHGCSNELHQAILGYCAIMEKPGRRPCPMTSSNDAFWRQDDTVYYSNFIMSAVNFHTRGLPETPEAASSFVASEAAEATPFGLAHYLNEEYVTGFFKYRWTDQSLFHKLIGVFAGPTEADYALDWSELRCDKRQFHPAAVFWHSKKHKSASDLRRCTKL